MKGCTITRELSGELDVVHLEGSLDAYSFPQLEAVLNELRQLNRNRVILNCSELEYISSAALGALIGFARRAHEQGGDLKLASVSTKIMSIIELLGFHKILEIVPDVDAAVAIFSD
jgi:anti-sigma B factor antagonist